MEAGADGSEIRVLLLGVLRRDGVVDRHRGRGLFQRVLWRGSHLRRPKSAMALRMRLANPSPQRGQKKDYYPGARLTPRHVCGGGEKDALLLQKGSDRGIKDRHEWEERGVRAATLWVAAGEDPVEKSGRGGRLSVCREGKKFEFFSRFGRFRLLRVFSSSECPMGLRSNRG